MLGPVIESERIRLEPPRAEHLATYGRWFEDTEVTALPAPLSGRRAMARHVDREIFKDDWEAQEGRA